MNSRHCEIDRAGAELDSQWLAAHWMPFTGNREFKAHPRFIASAAGAYYVTGDGRRIFDGLSGLWCTGLGHARKQIIEAVSRQIATLDYSPAFQFAHRSSFDLANRIVEKMPAGLNRVFFTGSGSESADTALKIARAYWRARGQGTKTRFIGRLKGYHGVNFGGFSVGGIVGNRKVFGAGIDVDHLPHTQPAVGSFFQGMPEKGAELADELLNLIALHDASNIAAVIVESLSGSAGVIVPPKGYLQRLREICTQHDILLIFDEVITAFGRTGAWTGAQAFGATPDILTIAKQVTNGTQPLGAAVVKQEIYDTFMVAGGPDHALERVCELAPMFERAVHSLRGARHVADVRNLGLAAGITVASAPGDPTLRPHKVAMAMYRKGFYVRHGGDTIQLAPPFVSTPDEIDLMVNALGQTFDEIE